jgi:hypothetical protein
MKAPDPFEQALEQEGDAMEDMSELRLLVIRDDKV